MFLFPRSFLSILKQLYQNLLLITVLEQQKNFEGIIVPLK